MPAAILPSSLLCRWYHQELQVWPKLIYNIYFYLFACAGFFLIAACRSSSLTRDRSVPPALGAQSLNHWTTREVPEQNKFKAL